MSENNTITEINVYKKPFYTLKESEYGVTKASLNNLSGNKIETKKINITLDKQTGLGKNKNYTKDDLIRYLKENRINVNDTKFVESLKNILFQCGREYGNNNEKINNFKNEIISLYERNVTNFISILSNNEASKEGSIIIGRDNNLKMFNESFDNGCNEYKVANKEEKIFYNETSLKIVG